MQEAVGGGAKAAVRTYPGLLSNEADEASFRHYATVQLVHLQLAVEMLLLKRRQNLILSYLNLDQIKLQLLKKLEQ